MSTFKKILIVLLAVLVVVVIAGMTVMLCRKSEASEIEECPHKFDGGVCTVCGVNEHYEITEAAIENVDGRAVFTLSGTYAGNYTEADFVLDVQETSGSWNTSALSSRVEVSGGRFTVKSDVTGLFANRYIFHLTVNGNTADNNVINIAEVEKNTLKLAKEYTLDEEDVFGNSTDYYTVLIIKNIEN